MRIRKIGRKVRQRTDQPQAETQGLQKSRVRFAHRSGSEYLAQRTKKTKSDYLPQRRKDAKVTAEGRHPEGMRGI